MEVSTFRSPLVSRGGASPSVMSTSLTIQVNGVPRDLVVEVICVANAFVSASGISVVRGPYIVLSSTPWMDEFFLGTTNQSLFRRLKDLLKNSPYKWACVSLPKKDCAHPPFEALAATRPGKAGQIGLMHVAAMPTAITGSKVFKNYTSTLTPFAPSLIGYGISTWALNFVQADSENLLVGDHQGEIAFVEQAPHIPRLQPLVRVAVPPAPAKKRRGPPKKSLEALKPSTLQC